MKKFTVGARNFIGIDTVPGQYNMFTVKKPFAETYLCGAVSTTDVDGNTTTWTKLVTIPPGQYVFIGRAVSLGNRAMYELMGLQWSFDYMHEGIFEELFSEWDEFTRAHAIYPETIILEVL